MATEEVWHHQGVSHHTDIQVKDGGLVSGWCVKQKKAGMTNVWRKWSPFSCRDVIDQTGQVQISLLIWETSTLLEYATKTTSHLQSAQLFTIFLISFHLFLHNKCSCMWLCTGSCCTTINVMFEAANQMYMPFIHTVACPWRLQRQWIIYAKHYN